MNRNPSMQAAKDDDPYTCPDGSTTTLIKKHKNRLTAVNSIHATTDGHKTRFVLSKGADTRMGGASKWGTAWTFSGGVSRSLRTATRWGMRKKAGHRMLQTRYTIGHYKNTLSERGSCVVWYRKSAISHEGGAESNRAYAMKVTKKYCRKYEKGGGLTLSKEKSTNWTNGLSMASIIGFDLESSSGYSSGEQIDVDITKPKRMICGANKPPGENPARVVVARR
ncbi:hypothetical protein [Nocardioides daphniae]|uniref:Uncharacterized protein n=1 Tax=Nocardioides daphniae TaxID=402297 RepID=A0A4P7U7M8_9ACTN|nr:hypothetical protein [Nocardioides daphniae]QCC76152.1 hypothetical protein E2C04_01145 [Nocardioides daphniae]